MKSGIKVFAPASVANVAVGYDILGFALDGPGDEIVATPTEAHRSIRIVRITGAQGKLPKEVDRNTAGYAAKKLLEATGPPPFGIDLEIRKKMPFGSGLGSSAASAAAAVVAVNELLGRPFEKRALLPYAVLGEQVADGAYHADNVAPALIGGIVLVRDTATLDIHRLPAPPGLYASVVHPDIEILTRDARNILAEHVSLEQHIRQNGNLAGFIVGLFRSDFDLIGRSLCDTVIEPQRARLIPHFEAVKKAAVDAGALGCSISGAGPSIFALSNNSLTAEAVGHAMQNIFAEVGITARLFISGINQEGAIKM